jgi:hypothetical protein
MKNVSSVVEDFESIRQYLIRLENERARNFSERAIASHKADLHERASISHLWISGKT